MDVDDSSDNDSDYRPELDKDNSDNEDEQRATTAPAFSLTKKRKLDSIFNSMLEEDKSFTTQKISNSVSNISNRRQSGSNDSCNSVRDTVSERKKKKRKKHMANILSQVFGRSEASKLVEHSISEEVDVKSLREASLESLKKIQRKKVVVEKKKFAGEEIA